MCYRWDQAYGKTDYSALKSKLDEIVAGAKARRKEFGGEYDAIVPISGGKDSAYCLHVMKKIYNCEILGFNFHNGFQTALARQNLDRLAEVYDVPLVTKRLPDSVMKAGYRAFMAEYHDPTCEFCTMCNGTGYWIIAEMAATLLKNKGYSPLIVGGWTKMYEEQPGVYGYTMKQYRDVLQKHGVLDLACKHVNRTVLEAMAALGDPRQAAAALHGIQLPEYLPWNHKKMLQVLEAEGWKRSEHGATHFDCWVHPISNYRKYLRFGFDQQHITNSALIRGGQLTRDEALEIDKAVDKSRPPELDRFLQWLEIKESDLHFDGK